jgi:purine-nucleoside phosphorylase
MSDFITLEMIDRAVEYIHSRTSQKPEVGLILGSGLGDMAESIQPADYIDYGDIPGWPRSTIPGHKGRLVIGKLESRTVLTMQGRVHYYEGYPMPVVAFPIRVMVRMGIKYLIVTNAAGAVNPDYLPGDLMFIKDHLSLIGMCGLNPLRGPNIDEMGERFPDMSHAYDPELLKLAKNVAVEKNIQTREGVYICLSGPSFETPADLRFLRIIGVDAVGMSTVPEVIVAHHGGIKVLGISGISNKANLDGSTETTHEEVLAAGKILVPKLDAIVRGVLRKLS